jgi:uncharacterized repeat protein (TIGR01451 family)
MTEDPVRQKTLGRGLAPRTLLAAVAGLLIAMGWSAVPNVKDAGPSNGEPRLLFFKGVDQTIAAAGGSLSYTITYRNRTSAAIAGFVIGDQLPPSTTLVSASNEPLTGRAPVVRGRLVEWDVGSLPAGPIFSVRLTVRIDTTASNGSFVGNVATARGIGVGPVHSNLVETLVNTPIP